MKEGDYVEIVAGVHDDRMPDGRRDGLIMEFAGHQKDQVFVMFSNGQFLKFHKSQVNVIDGGENESR